MTEEPTETRIRLAAFKLFSEQGYHGTSMRDVAKEISVSVGVVTYHFSSKEALYLGAVEGPYAAFSDRIRTIVQSGEPSSERLKHLMELLAYAQGDDLRLLRLLLRQILSGAAPLGPMVPMFLKGHVGPVLGLMMEAVRDGVLDVRYVPGIAPLLVGGMTFSAMFAHGVSELPMLGALAVNIPKHAVTTMCLMLGIDP